MRKGQQEAQSQETRKEHFEGRRAIWARRRKDTKTIEKMNAHHANQQRYEDMWIHLREGGNSRHTQDTRKTPHQTPHKTPHKTPRYPATTVKTTQIPTNTPPLKTTYYPAMLCTRHSQDTRKTKSKCPQDSLLGV